MSAELELSFELELTGASSPHAVEAEFRRAVGEAVAESGLGTLLVAEPEQRYEQPLPLTPDQAEMLKVAVVFVLEDILSLSEGFDDLFWKLTLQFAIRPHDAYGPNDDLHNELIWRLDAVLNAVLAMEPAARRRQFERWNCALDEPEGPRSLLLAVAAS